MNAPIDILYSPRGRFRSIESGAQRSSDVGGIGVFRDHAPFLRYPDARRIDLRATLRDPFGETYVKRFERRHAIDVIALVDVSASMRFPSTEHKIKVIWDFCAALAYSVTRIGDRFGVMGCGETIHRSLMTAPSRSVATALAAVERLRASTCADAGADGFLTAREALGSKRKLVFLASDFRWPWALIDRVFESLSRHDLVPLVVTDSTEESPPDWGLLQLIDSEDGRRRMMFMRPALKRRWIEREAERRREIARLATDRARRPIFLRDGFDPADLSLRLMAS
ncbi:DUF58 domain-containing protein [Methylocapsa palsarum]|uniref:DUF58 domain-containing protein n=1 Tax=Methylocapsa palsarum TaxID=1612308 RepID=A0A1I4AWI5_9HYPH|nr:DUF58 domain-containing protein [Methylocapsa palsarum]SFK60962.1 Protein of unknown function DUF58 [Methylocapsa palsarum]